MVECSTLFFIINNIEKRNELFTGDDLNGIKIDVELRDLLGGLEYIPGEKSLEKIFEKAL